MHMCNGHGRSPIQLAINSKHVELVGLLLNAGVSVNAYVSERHLRTLLHHACSERERYDIACLLIERGADVNAIDIKSEPPMAVPVCYDNINITRLLIENGASVNCVAIDNSTAIHEVARGKI